MNEGLPEAYKKGVQDFYGREFFVSPDVLIPRPETETIVDAVLNLAGVAYLLGVKPGAAKLSRKMRILDVGTGSGCVAITLKKEIPEAEVSAVDISEKALAIARKNAEKIGVEIEFYQSDLLSNIFGDFEVIVANLPYVDENWEWLDKEKLSFEPSLALFAGDGGVKLIFELIKQVCDRCQFLILEADPCQHEKIIEFAEKNGFVLDETRGFVLVFEQEK